VSSGGAREAGRGRAQAAVIVVMRCSGIQARAVLGGARGGGSRGSSG
jgi:hypothetical protein